MQAAQGYIPNSQPKSSPVQKPSVPMSVYRDLSTELQAAQVMVESLTTKNEKLVAENQHLRQEIARAVQSVLHLQKVVDSYAAPNYNKAPYSSPDIRTQPKAKPLQTHAQPKVSPPPPTLIQPPVFENNLPTQEPIYPEPIYLEEQEVRYYEFNESRPREVNGWFLLIGIFIVIMSAFGTGYLIVRPLFENPNAK
jgi:hypothetical protein